MVVFRELVMNGFYYFLSLAHFCSTFNSSFDFHARERKRLILNEGDQLPKFIFMKKFQCYNLVSLLFGNEKLNFFSFLGG